MQETSIAFQTNKTPAEYRALAEVVNRYAFDVVSVYSDLPFQTSHAALLLMAPYLQRARLGPACVSPSRMSPIDMAGPPPPPPSPTPPPPPPSPPPPPA